MLKTFFFFIQMIAYLSTLLVLHLENYSLKLSLDIMVKFLLHNYFAFQILHLNNFKRNFCKFYCVARFIFSVIPLYYFWSD